MAVTVEEARAYARSVLQQLEKAPEKLSEHERRLATKFKISDEKLQGILQDCDSMRSQIQQAQARLRSLELQAENEQGRCNGLIDFLVDLKFGETPPTPPTAAEVTRPEAKTSSTPSGSKKAKLSKNNNGKHAAA